MNLEKDFTDYVINQAIHDILHNKGTTLDLNTGERINKGFSEVIK